MTHESPIQNYLLGRVQRTLSAWNADHDLPASEASSLALAVFALQGHLRRLPGRTELRIASSSLEALAHGPERERLLRGAREHLAQLGWLGEAEALVALTGSEGPLSLAHEREVAEGARRLWLELDDARLALVVLGAEVGEDLRERIEDWHAFAFEHAEAFLDAAALASGFTAACAEDLEERDPALWQTAGLHETLSEIAAEAGELGSLHVSPAAATVIRLFPALVVTHFLEQHEALAASAGAASVEADLNRICPTLALSLPGNPGVGLAMSVPELGYVRFDAIRLGDRSQSEALDGYQLSVEGAVREATRTIEQGFVLFELTAKDVRSTLELRFSLREPKAGREVPLSPAPEPRDMGQEASGEASALVELAPPKTLRGEIEQVLEQAGCSPPRHGDRRPLYAYELTPARFLRLGERLSRHLRVSHSLNEWGAAAFCLYAARAFCSGYEEGTWSWATITNRLEVELPQAKLRELAREGLRFWRRAVARPTGDRSLYLVSLICEGGLPLKLLTQQNAALTRYFRHVLQTCELYEGWAPRRAAEHFAAELPQSLRNKTVYELTGSLIESVRELRLELRNLGQVADPVAALDARSQGWRNRLPLRLHDEVARELLTGLLKMRTATLREEILLRIETQLEFPAGQDFAAQVQRVLRLRPQVSRAALPGEGDLPSMLRLSLERADGRSHSLAFATQTGGGRYRLERTGPEALSDSADVLQRFELVAHHAANVLGRSEPPGGEALDPELPWVFVQGRSGAWRLKATGSCRVAKEEVILALASSAQLEEPAGELLELQSVPGLERALWRLRGRVSVRAADDRFEIVTGAEDAEELRFSLRGRQTQLGAGGATLFLGSPWIEAQGPADQVVHAELSWRPAGLRGDWRTSREQPLGDVQVRGTHRGQTVFRGEALVLPREFSARWRPGPGANEGCVELKGLPFREAVLIEAGENVELEPNPTSQELVVRCTAGGGETPSSIELRVRLRDGHQATLCLDSPVIRQRFLGPGRRALANPTQVTLDQLAGSVAEASCEQPCPGRFVLNGKGSHRHSPSQFLSLLEADCGREGLYQLPLHRLADEVEALLAQSDSLNAYASLFLDDERNPEARVELRVGHFDAAFDKLKGFGPEGCSLVLASDCRERLRPELKRLSVRAERLWDPDAERVDLRPELDEEGWPTWRVQLSELESAGAWLVTGWVEDHARLRPILVTLGESRDFPRGSEFEGAVHAAKDVLTQEADRLLGALATRGPTHPAWSMVLRLLSRSRRLPLATYRMVQRLSQVPQALALATLLDVNTMCELWPRWERGPFLWELVPLRAWVGASRTLQLLFAEVDIAVASTVAPLLESHASRSPCTRTVQWALLQAEALRPKEGDSEAGRYDAEVRALLESKRGREKATAKLNEETREYLRRRVGQASQLKLSALRDALRESRVPRQIAGRVEELAVRTPGREQEGLANAPLFAAAVQVFGERLPSRKVMGALRRAIAGDEPWFRSTQQRFAQILIGHARHRLEYLP